MDIAFLCGLLYYLLLTLHFLKMAGCSLVFAILLSLSANVVTSASWGLPTVLNRIATIRGRRDKTSNIKYCHKPCKGNKSPRCDYGCISGFDFLRRPWLNRGSSFNHQERQHYSIQGLIPGGETIPLRAKVLAAMTQFRQQIRPIDKYTYLHTLQDTDETLYYALLTQHTVEVLPFVYTPTVGEACQKWSHISHSAPRGLYLSSNDRGNLKQLLQNYPLTDIKVIVVTDGERILGLGDLGCNGMGIPVGKLALYSACAGVHPQQCLPVHIDVGTNTASLIADPVYQGLKQPRIRGQEYDDLLSEFVTACQDVYGQHVLIQFEDFANSNAFRLLNKFKDEACVFNDDIQGTAAVVLSGLLSSLRLLEPGKQKLADQTFLFSGAGSAGVGVADLLSNAIVAESKGLLSVAEARQRIWLVDSQGLVTSKRDMSTLQAHKIPYAHQAPAAAITLPPPLSTGRKSPLAHAVDTIQPTALLGMSAQKGSFTEDICRQMGVCNKKPIIFALSNPTDKSECTAAEAYEWTNGRCIFASGSPFADVQLGAKTFVPGQCNNAYIFPAIGLAVRLSGATKITDEDFYIAAVTLSKMVTKEQMQEDGNLFPSFDRIREVSLEIAVAVAEGIVASGRATSAPLISLVTSSSSPTSGSSSGGSSGAPEDTSKSLSASIRSSCEAVMYDPMSEGRSE